MKLVVGEYQPAIWDIEIDDFSQQDLTVLLPANDGTNRRCDVGGRETARGNLVKQGLKKVVVVPIDNRNLDLRLAEFSCGFESAETTANDYDMWKFGLIGWCH